MRCQQCGAVNDPGALECRYCKATTPAGVQARQRREYEEAAARQRSAAVHAQEHQAARARLESASRQALGWSIGGLALCCLPLGIVGIVQGVRARRTAASLGVPLPITATIGLVLGCLGALVSVAVFTWAAIDSVKKSGQADVRIAELEKRAEARSADPVLAHETACTLAEAYALKTGYDSHPGYSLSGFECVGNLTVDGASAELDALRFRWSSDSVVAHVCFKRGARWYVEALEKDACPR